MDGPATLQSIDELGEPSEAPTNELVLNRYRPICRLGRGGQADVYLATTPGPADFHRLVVIKVLRESRSHVGNIDGFMAEARLAARLNHPNVVQTMEVSDYRGRPCIVMEHLEGQPLDRVRHAARVDKSADASIWVRIIADALAGLGYAHELADYERKPLNIVHRDVSPQNIFVTYHGQVKVLDFGIAHADIGAPETAEGIVKGKANYMAPEQAKNRPVDARADIFSMGVVLWELLTGVRLVKGDGAKAIYNLLHEDFPRVRDRVPKIAPELDDIVMKALEKDPARRYPSAAAMRQALTAYLERSPTSARTDDVAQLVQILFDAERDSVRRKIREFMSRGSAPDLTTSTYSLTVDSMRVPVLSTAVHTQMSGAQQAAGSSTTFWAGSALAIAAIAGVGFFAASTWQAAPAPGDAAGAVGPVASSFLVDSEPAGAKVFVEGESVGVTPVRLDVSDADRTLRLGATGYVDASLDVAAGAATSRFLVLQASDGEVAAKDAKEGADEAAKASAPTRTRRVRYRRRAPSKAEDKSKDDEAKAAKEPEPSAAPPPAAPARPKVKVIEEQGPDVRVID